MSEFRRDLISGDWIIVSKERGKRPHQFKAKKRKRAPKKGCVFENPSDAAFAGAVITSVPAGPNWKVQVIPNKYPAVSRDGIWVLNESQEGPFLVLPGYGYHEVVITRDHDDSFADLQSKDAFTLLKVLRERYRNLSSDRNVSYIHIFANHGETAGASIYHPHYQILAIPIVPPDVSRSLHGSKEYYKKHKSCVHCAQVAWEIKKKKRIIYETKHTVVIAPYVSKEPFEMHIFPKTHRPYFEDSSDAELADFADAMQKALSKLKKSLNDPDYNFFIHTSPSKNREKYSHYHWHLEIFPRTNISAGFELGTSVELNPVDPDNAATFLRNAR